MRAEHPQGRSHEGSFFYTGKEKLVFCLVLFFGPNKRDVAVFLEMNLHFIGPLCTVLIDPTGGRTEFGVGLARNWFLS